MRLVSTTSTIINIFPSWRGIMKRKLILIVLLVSMWMPFYGDSVCNVGGITFRLGSLWVDTNIKENNKPINEKFIIMGMMGNQYLLASKKSNYIYICDLEVCIEQGEQNSGEQKRFLKGRWDGNTSNQIAIPPIGEPTSSVDVARGAILIQRYGYLYKYTNEKNDIVESKTLRAVSYYSRDYNKQVIYFILPPNQPKRELDGYFINSKRGTGENALTLINEMEYAPDIAIDTEGYNCLDMDLIDLNGIVSGKDGNTDWSKQNYIHPLIVIYANKNPQYAALISNTILAFDGRSGNKAKVVFIDNMEINENESIEGWTCQTKYGRAITGPGAVWMNKDGELCYVFGRSNWSVERDSPLFPGYTWFYSVRSMPLTIDYWKPETDPNTKQPVNFLTIGLKPESMKDLSWARSHDWASGGVGTVWNAARYCEKIVLRYLAPNNVLIQVINNIDEDTLSYVPVFGKEFSLGLNSKDTKGVYMSTEEIEKINKTLEVLEPKLDFLADNSFARDFDPSLEVITIMYGWPYNRVADKSQVCALVCNKIDTQSDMQNYSSGVNFDLANGMSYGFGEIASMKVGIKTTFDYKHAWGTTKAVSSSIALKYTNAEKYDSYFWGDYGIVMYKKNEGLIDSYLRIIPIGTNSKYTNIESPWITYGKTILPCTLSSVVAVPTNKSDLRSMAFKASDPKRRISVNEKEDIYSLLTAGLGVSEDNENNPPTGKPCSLLSTSPNDTINDIDPKIQEIIKWQNVLNLSQLIDLCDKSGSGITSLYPNERYGLFINTNTSETIEINVTESVTASESDQYDGSVGVVMEWEVKPGTSGGFGGWGKNYIGYKGGKSNQKTNAVTSGINLNVPGDSGSRQFARQVYRFKINVTQYKLYLKENNMKDKRPWFIPKFAWIQNNTFVLMLPYMPNNPWSDN